MASTATMSQDSLQSFHSSEYSDPGSEPSDPPGDERQNSDGTDPPDDDSSHTQAGSDNNSPQTSAKGHVAPYQYRYGMFVDSLPKLEVPKFDEM